MAGIDTESKAEARMESIRDVHRNTCMTEYDKLGAAVRELSPYMGASKYAVYALPEVKESLSQVKKIRRILDRFEAGAQRSRVVIEAQIEAGFNQDPLREADE